MMNIWKKIIFVINFCLSCVVDAVWPQQHI